MSDFAALTPLALEETKLHISYMRSTELLFSRLTESTLSPRGSAMMLSTVISMIRYVTGPFRGHDLGPFGHHLGPKRLHRKRGNLLKPISLKVAIQSTNYEFWNQIVPYIFNIA
jgi:hypothetical protein